MNNSYNLWTEGNGSVGNENWGHWLLDNLGLTNNNTKENLENTIMNEKDNLKQGLTSVNQKMNDTKQIDSGTAATIDTTGWDLEKYKTEHEKAEKSANKAVSYIKNLEKLVVESYQDGVETMAAQANSVVGKAPMSNKAKIEQMTLFKNIRMNPPPNFIKLGNMTAAALLIFLNEEFEEYAYEMTFHTLTEKCQVLPKIFVGETIKAIDFKEKTKLFLRWEVIQMRLKNGSIDTRELYNNLVQYVFGRSATADFKKRVKGQSLTVYCEKLWTLKEYCGIEKDKIGEYILKEVMEKPELFNTTKEIFYEFKKKFYIKVLTKEVINKNEVISFAGEIDLLNSEETEHSSGGSCLHAFNETAKEPALNGIAELMALQSELLGLRKA